MKRTTIALAAGATVAGAALGLRALMRRQAIAALPIPTPNLALSVPGFAVLERITGGIDPAQPMPLVLVLHGIGGDMAQLDRYTRIKVPARLVYVRGPLSNPRGVGYSYFGARFNSANFMAELAAAAAEIVRVADTVASQRAVTCTLVLGYSQGGHIAWLLAGTDRFDIVIPVSGALAPTYQPSPSTGRTTIHALHGEDDRTLPVTASAATFRAFTAAGYRGDYKRVRAGHSLTTIGDSIAPILSASLDPKPVRGSLASQIRGR